MPLASKIKTAAARTESAAEPRPNCSRATVVISSGAGLLGDIDGNRQVFDAVFNNHYIGGFAGGG